MGISLGSLQVLVSIAVLSLSQIFPYPPFFASV